LHEFADTGTRTSKDLVEVRIDGHRVGQLTPKMSGDLLPAVRHLAAKGLLTVVKAKVKGNRLKAEITIHSARAHELPADWPGEVRGPRSAPAPETVSRNPALRAGAVESVAAAVSPSAAPAPGALAAAGPPAAAGPIPPKPTRIRFVPAPGWPPPPDGWEPPPGWMPDPAWPPAPAGWQFWAME
jgi:hypothetical protein